MTRTDELQLDRPDPFLRRERIVQKIGLVALTLFVGAGAFGAFGNGPIARVSTQAGGTVVTYERFGRTTAPTSVVIEVSSAAGDAQPVRFRLEREFMRDLDFLEVRPSDALRGFDAHSAIFEVDAESGSGHVELHFKPNRPGVYQTTVTPERGSVVRLWQFIYY
jgi:hypothetical protein